MTRQKISHSSIIKNQQSRNFERCCENMFHIKYQKFLTVLGGSCELNQNILVCLVYLQSALVQPNIQYRYLFFPHFLVIEKLKSYIMCPNALQYFWDSYLLSAEKYLNFFLCNTLPIVNTNPLLLFNMKLTLARWGPGNHFNGLIIGWPSGIVYMSKYPTGYVLPKGCCIIVCYLQTTENRISVHYCVDRTPKWL